MSMQSSRPVEDLLSRLQGVKGNGKGWTARCPGHEDKQNSLSISMGQDGRVLLHCFSGCKTPDIIARIGLEMQNLFTEKPKNKRESITVAELAADKGLPSEYLKELRVVDQADLHDNKFIRISYLREDASLAPRQRIRTGLRAKDGSSWSKGKEPIVLYGLWRLHAAHETGYQIFTEGESDCWTLWFHGYSALGFPGATTAKLLDAKHLEGVSRIYIWREPDKGGEAFVAGIARRLMEIGWKGQAYVISIDGVKDPNDLHKKDPEHFKTVFQETLDKAIPLEALPNSSAEEYPEFDVSLKDPRRFFLKRDFLPNVMAREMLESDSFISSPIDDSGKGVNLFVYEGGVYRSGESLARRHAHRLLDYLSKPDRLDMTVAMLKECVKISANQINPRAMDLINVENGMLDWRTGQLLPHSKDYFSTFQIHATYDPNAKCPRVDCFLSEVFPKDAIPLCQEMIGYLMIPTSCYQKCFILVGLGANGKSTFLMVVEALVGPENTSHLALQEFSDNRFAAAGLLNKLVNIYPDLPSRAVEQSDVFKAIVGGDVIKAERKFQHPFDLRTVARLLFSANEIPRSRDLTPAFFRRLQIIPFSRVFKGKQADKTLLKKLQTPEARSTLLNHALIGLRRLDAQQGFTDCPSVLAATEKYRRQCDNLYEFVREKLQVASGCSLTKEEVYKAYKAWCEDSGVPHPLSQRSFNKRISETSGVREAREVLADGKKHRVWQGFSWLEDGQESQETDTPLDREGPERPGSPYFIPNVNVPSERGEGLKGEKLAEPGPAGPSRSAELPSALAEWPAYWKDLFEERSGKLEFEDGFNRQEAETRAEAILRQEYARQNQPGDIQMPLDLEGIK